MGRPIKHLRVRKSGLNSRSITIPYEYDAEVGDLFVWREEKDCVVLTLLKANTLEKLAVQEPVEAA